MGTAAPAGDDAGDITPSDRKATVTQFYRLMNERRFDEMWTLFHDDATWSGGGRQPRFSAGIDHMKTVIVDPMPVFVTGGIEFTVYGLTAEEDRVAAEVESHAELVNGAVYHNSYHMLFRFRGPRIVEVKEYGDTLHAKEVFVDSGAMSAEALDLGG